MSDELLLRQRPTTVEAKRITSDNRDDIIAWINETATAWSYGSRGITWHGNHPVTDAFIGDWVVRTPWGEFQKVSDSVLFSRYESIVAAVSE